MIWALHLSSQLLPLTTKYSAIWRHDVFKVVTYREWSWSGPGARV